MYRMLVRSSTFNDLKPRQARRVSLKVSSQQRKIVYTSCIAPRWLDLMARAPAAKFLQFFEIWLEITSSLNSTYSDVVFSRRSPAANTNPKAYLNSHSHSHHCSSSISPQSLPHDRYPGTLDQAYRE